MKKRIAINGFGRIGRLALRSIFECEKDVELVAVNSSRSLENDAHLLTFDSLHGRFTENVEILNQNMKIGAQDIVFSKERDPQNLKHWQDLNIDIVLECTGAFRKGEAVQPFLQHGASKVLISAPADNVDKTIVMGVNDDTLTPDDIVVSNASCTTNALAPVAHVLHQNFGIEQGFMTTIHAYTADQNLVDGSHKDMRRARSAALSMVPTSTGAAKAIGLVIPELAGKLDGTAMRVPTANVSALDLHVMLNKKVSKDDINNAFLHASEEGSLEGILGVTNLPLVSCDFNHSAFSSTVDLSETHVKDGFARILAWYDNEWAYACRMVDVALKMASL